MKSIAPLFCQMALSQVSDLNGSERADLYDFAGEVLRFAGCHDHAEAAKTAATDIRNAEAAQTRFVALLSAAIEMNPVQ